MSPHELYFLKKPNLGHLRVFHNIVYVHVPKEKRRMLDAKAEKCIFATYSDDHKGYKCYITSERNMSESVEMSYSTSRLHGTSLRPIRPPWSCGLGRYPHS